MPYRTCHLEPWGPSGRLGDASGFPLPRFTSRCGLAQRHPLLGSH